VGRKIVISRDIIFDEYTLPGKAPSDAFSGLFSFQPNFGSKEHIDEVTPKLGNPSLADTFAAVLDHDAGESENEVDTSPHHASPVASTYLDHHDLSDCAGFLHVFRTILSLPALPVWSLALRFLMILKLTKLP
jgi:hypothetical protein